MYLMYTTFSDLEYTNYYKLLISSKYTKVNILCPHWWLSDIPNGIYFMKQDITYSCVQYNLLSHELWQA